MDGVSPQSMGSYEPALQHLSLQQQAQLYCQLHMHLCHLHGMTYAPWGAAGGIAYAAPYAYGASSMWQAAPGPVPSGQAMGAMAGQAVAQQKSTNQARLEDAATRTSGNPPMLTGMPAAVRAQPSSTAVPLQSAFDVLDSIFESIDDEIDVKQDSGDWSSASEGTHDTAHQNNKGSACLRGSRASACDHELQQQGSIIGPMLLDGVVPLGGEDAVLSAGSKRSLDRVASSDHLSDCGVVPSSCCPPPAKMHKSSASSRNNAATTTSLGMSKGTGIMAAPGAAAVHMPLYDPLCDFLDANFDNFDFTSIPLLA